VVLQTVIVTLISPLSGHAYGRGSISGGNMKSRGRKEILWSYEFLISLLEGEPAVVFAGVIYARVLNVFKWRGYDCRAGVVECC
jgi:hypothetical protein